MHIYVFGSLCRGEISDGSDVDILAVVADYDPRLNPEEFSIYSYARLSELWREGNPFAWHLHLEARLIYASDSVDFLRSLGPPAGYSSCLRDCEKFLGVFTDARDAIAAGTKSVTFELSTIFLAIRNIATCFSLGVTAMPVFARHAAQRLGANSLDIPPGRYAILERARILSTRGKGETISVDEVALVLDSLDTIMEWMNRLVQQARHYERIQKSNGCAASDS
jgi:nucleotidyltransferase-like protein